MSDKPRPVINKDSPANALYRCFDCGAEFEGHAGSAAFVGTCPECRVGMLIVSNLDGSATNRGFFPKG